MVGLSDFVLRATVSEEIGKAAIGRLRVAHGFEVLLGDLVRNTGMRIALDPELRSLGRWSGYRDILADGETQFRFAQYLDLLDDTVRTNPLFHSIVLVLDEADYVLSSESGTSPRATFDDRSWLEPICGQWGFEGTSRFLPPHRMGGSNDLVLSYYFPFPSYLTDLRGAVVVHLREREFSRLINDSTRQAEGQVSLVDDQGILLSHGDPALVGRPWPPGEQVGILGSTLSEGTLTQEGAGGRLFTWFRPEGGWGTYVGEFSLADLSRNVGTLRLVTFAVSLVLVVVGVGGSYLLARRFLHPVRRLIREVNRRIGSQEGWEGNELSLLSGAFDILLKRETQMFTEEWVARALRGDPLSGKTEDWEGGRLWLAGVVSIDHYSSFVQGYPADQREYLRSTLLAMAARAFLPEIRALGTVTDPRGLSLVFSTDLEDGGLFADRIDDGFELLLAEARKGLGTSITLCLGSRGPGRAYLPTSWAEAQALVHQRFLQGPGHWFWEENPSVCSSTPFFPLKNQRLLIAAMERRDLPALEEELAELRSSLLGRRDLRYDHVQLVLHQVVGAVVRHLVEANLDLTRLFGDQADLHRVLSEFESLEDALDWLGSLVRELSGRDPEAPRPGYVAAMVAFIRENLHRDFSVEEVAEAAGLSYSHARRLFEEAFGETILEHVNALRIEEARQLLSATDWPLEAVAVSVGYNNGQSFHRQFRKATGVTPGEYRGRKAAVQQK